MSGIVIVALPLGERTVTYADGDVVPVHQTLIYLGDTANAYPTSQEMAQVNVEVEEIAQHFGIATAKVSGKGTLGPEQERIVITESMDLNVIRENLLDNFLISELIGKAPQHPHWIPHVTGMQNLVYGDILVFDRLAVWYGDSKQSYFLSKIAPVIELD